MLFLILLYTPNMTVGNESSAIFLIHMTAIFLIHMTAKWLLLDLLVEETRKKYETPNLARKFEDTKVVI
jgi:hypothetical protein